MPTFEHVPHTEEILRWMSPATGHDFRILKLDEGAQLIQEDPTTIPLGDGESFSAIVEAEELDDEPIYVLQESQYDSCLRTVPQPIVLELLRIHGLVNEIKKATDRDRLNSAVNRVKGPATYSTVIKGG